MIRNYTLTYFKGAVSALGALFLLASCSSYNYVGYENDGIYSSSPKGEAYTASDYKESYEDALYYQNLFGEKAEQFAAVPEEGAIFTDVEAYSSGQFDPDFENQELNYEPGRAAWGSNPDEIAINIYNNYPVYNPFYNPYIYPYYAGIYDPFWGPGYYRPYRYGYAYGGWGWNMGWGYYGWNGYYGPRYPYYHHYYPYYGNRYNNYYGQNVAYNSGRRDAYVNRSNNATRYDSERVSSDRDNARISRVQGYSNTRKVRAAGTVRDTRNYQSRSSRVQSAIPSRTSESSRVYRRSEAPAVRRSTPARSVNTQSRSVRSVRSTPSSNSTYRSSSSSSTRSSGSSTSRSSRGRGN